jgi:hypothetical protein
MVDRIVCSKASMFSFLAVGNVMNVFKPNSERDLPAVEHLFTDFAAGFAAGAEVEGIEGSSS